MDSDAQMNGTFISSDGVMSGRLKAPPRCVTTSQIATGDTERDRRTRTTITSTSPGTGRGKNLTAIVDFPVHLQPSRWQRRFPPPGRADG